MIDPAIRQLLDSYFTAPEEAGVPGVAKLRAAAVDASRLFSGTPPGLADVRDARRGGGRAGLDRHHRRRGAAISGERIAMTDATRPC